MSLETRKLAAMAVGFWSKKYNCYVGPTDWNPNENDGDCARMEAALGIDVRWFDGGVIAEYSATRRMYVSAYFKYHNGDKNLARRVVSTQLAAAIGRLLIQ